jgi:circadian clock protein KaiC
MTNEKLDTLVRSGQVTMMSVRALDLSVDEMLHELSGMIDAKGATRIVLDSLSGFELATAPEYREDFREALYRLVTVLAAKGVTVLMTCEMEDRYQELRFSPYGSSVLVDAVIMQRYVESQSELRTVISVIKVRGRKHSREIRSFEISEGAQIRIGEGPVPFDGVLLGSLQARHA